MLVYLNVKIQLRLCCSLGSKTTESIVESQYKNEFGINKNYENGADCLDNVVDFLLFNAFRQWFWL